MKAWAGITSFFEKLALDIPLILGILSIYYKRRVCKEIEAACIRYGDRVLCIGGGPCPLTAIYIHKLTGAHITVVDNNSDAVRIGSRFIRKMNLNSAITFVQSEGESIDLNGFSMVHVALQVTPREKVIKHIQHYAGPNVQILVRGCLTEKKACLDPDWNASRIEGLSLYPTMVLSRYLL
jgi:threonine dehydrogenase-like Zn-dependent dehydrogenase